MFPLVNGLENFYQDTEISMRIASRVGVDSFPLICIEVFQTTYQKISGYQKKGFAPFLLPLNIGFRLNVTKVECRANVFALPR